MVFKSYRLINGGLELGYENGWHWSRSKGDYFNHRDFLWVHWEIADAAPHGVKLHVESPKADVDAELKDLKQQIVAAFLAPRFQNLVEEGGYGYKRGGRVQMEHLKRYKSTEVLRVVLTEHQSQGTHQANITLVNEVMGPAVREVMERFASQLSSQFVR